jgi:hypothetical protein
MSGSEEEVEDWDREFDEYHASATRGIGALQYGSPIPAEASAKSQYSGSSDGARTPSRVLSSADEDIEEFKVDYDLEETWIECIEGGTNRVLWYNSRTLMVVTDVENLIYESPGGTLRKHERDALSFADSKRHIAKLVGDDIDDAFGRARREQVIRTPDQILQTISNWSLECKEVLKQTFLSEPVREKLDSLSQQMEQLLSLVEEEEKNAGKDDVAVLVSAMTIGWNFNNDYVAGYRAKAVQVPHEQFRYPDFNFPMYFSRSPLPSHLQAPIPCDIVLCKELEPYFDRKFVPITINATDTANLIVERLFQKLPTSVNVSEYVLKGLTLHEYMDGDDLMYNYETIRSCLRRRTPVQLKLVPYPPVIEYDEYKNLSQNYKASVVKGLPVISEEDFLNLSSQDKLWYQMEFINLWDVEWPYRVWILGCDYISTQSLPRLDTSITKLSVRTFLYHGLEIFKRSDLISREVPLGENPRWSECMEPKGAKSIILGSLPRETRIAFILYGKSAQSPEIVLGWACLPLVDQYGRLNRGKKSLKLWPTSQEMEEAGELKDLNFILVSTLRDNGLMTAGYEHTTLTVEFDKFNLPVVAPFIEPFREPNPIVVGEKVDEKKNKKFKTRLDAIVRFDPLYVLTDADKQDIWKGRHLLTNQPLALPKFLQSVDWFSPDHRHEAHRLLLQWDPPRSPVSAIELLDGKYADYMVRDYAVKCLKVLQDDELRLFLLQLVQTLKFESYHDSPVSRFLIERALRHPYCIGHNLFWHLRAESWDKYHCERYAVILEEYLAFEGPHTSELKKQFEICNKFMQISSQIRNMKRKKEQSDQEILQIYREKLQRINESYLSQIGHFYVPLNPKWKVSTLVVEKCRYMSSKMAPLWLVFRNVDPDGADIYVIFKSGDDLRQDILTLQLIQVLDKVCL